MSTEILLDSNNTTSRKSRSAMVTIRLAQSALINPFGARPILSAEQAWAALVRKARRPQDFVPVVSSCEIITETDTKIEAVVNFKPGVAHATRIREVCTLQAPCRLDYAMEDGSMSVNIVSMGPGRRTEDLVLTFYFSWEHPGVEEGSTEAKEIFENHLKV
ncbi:hypothetical protein jhhlp_008353 [Lomentospora prolificans]|uniref:DUF1857 domain-containing protein n=1 Tax=Lomentospora prolificans TaxID=41688 RepID=A0A2N3MXU0_9PEZI|nr:hypothetical protein jhhlp_008353 [Lomentospora prolificans]